MSSSASARKVSGREVSVSKVSVSKVSISKVSIGKVSGCKVSGGKVPAFVGILYFNIKFGYFEKATKFEKIFHLKFDVTD